MIGHHCFSHDTACSLALSADLFLLNSLNIDLTRFLQEWENRLHLNDCAKDSPPVWPREYDLFSLTSWASITCLSLVTLANVFLLATIFISISFTCLKLLTWLLNLSHCFFVVSAFMSQSSISRWSYCFRLYLYFLCENFPTSMIHILGIVTIPTCDLMLHQNKKYKRPFQVKTIKK